MSIADTTGYPEKIAQFAEELDALIRKYDLKVWGWDSGEIIAQENGELGEHPDFVVWGPEE
jgi:hypothetical protein